LLAASADSRRVDQPHRHMLVVSAEGHGPLAAHPGPGGAPRCDCIWRDVLGVGLDRDFGAIGERQALAHRLDGARDPIAA
jgi:hypothetical protein